MQKIKQHGDNIAASVLSRRMRLLGADGYLKGVDNGSGGVMPCIDNCVTAGPMAFSMFFSRSASGNSKNR